MIFMFCMIHNNCYVYVLSAKSCQFTLWKCCIPMLAEGPGGVNALLNGNSLFSVNNERKKNCGCFRATSVCNLCFYLHFWSSISQTVSWAVKKGWRLPQWSKVCFLGVTKLLIRDIYVCFQLCVLCWTQFDKYVWWPILISPTTNR